MGKMRELYENIWYCYVDQGMTPDEISEMYHVPIAWVHGALEIAEADEHYDEATSHLIH